MFSYFDICYNRAPDSLHDDFLSHGLQALHQERFCFCGIVRNALLSEQLLVLLPRRLLRNYCAGPEDLVLRLFTSSFTFSAPVATASAAWSLASAD